MRNENETRIQQEIVQYVRKTYCKPEHEPRLICNSVPNGIGLKVPKSMQAIVHKAIATAVELSKQIGMMEGASDLQIHGVFGRCAHVEVKTSTGKQRDKQIEFQQRIEALGGRYYLVRSLEDVKKIDFTWLLGN